MMKRQLQVGNQLESCRRMLTCSPTRDRTVTRRRRSAESPDRDCSPNGLHLAAPAPLGERVSTERRVAGWGGGYAWQRGHAHYVATAPYPRNP